MLDFKKKRKNGALFPTRGRENCPFLRVKLPWKSGEAGTIVKQCRSGRSSDYEMISTDHTFNLYVTIACMYGSYKKKHVRGVI